MENVAELQPFRTVVDSYLNSPFFVALLEAYLGNDVCNFQNVESHIVRFTEEEGKTYITYKTNNEEARGLMMKAISTLGKLMPFVPSSVIALFQSPVVMVEISKMDTRVFFLENSMDPVPVAAYGLTRGILEWLAEDTHRLVDNVKYRFAITAESFKTDAQELVYPDARECLDTVFGDFMSHLVLLVASDEPAPCSAVPLKWFGSSKVTQRVAEFVEKKDREVSDEDKHFCLYMCADDDNNGVLGDLPLYTSEGTVQPCTVCCGCMKYIISDMITPFCKKETLEIDPELLSKQTTLLEDPFGGEIPFGPLLWALISNKDISAYTRAWISAALDIAFRLGKEYSIHCPNHPESVQHKINSGETVKCKHCALVLCGKCREWHMPEDPCPELPPGYKRCPRCRVLVFKNGGNNRITCRCGSTWCWTCLADFKTQQECYEHLREVHGGYW